MERCSIGGLEVRLKAIISISASEDRVSPLFTHLNSLMFQGFLQIFLTLLVVILLAPIVGHYLFQAFTGHQTIFGRLLNPIEQQIYRLSGIELDEAMSGQEYAIAVVVSNTAMAIFVYEYSSAAAGNGSGFEGLADTEPASTALWWNLSTTLTLWAGRFIPIVVLLLLAESLSLKPLVFASTMSLKTDTWLFTGITASTILILGALTFLPVLALGPIAEAFQLAQGG